MAIHIRYKGYELEFERYPTAAEMHAAWEGLQDRERKRLDHSDVIPARLNENDRQRPLSFAQEWFWSLEQLAGGNPAYHLPLGVVLDGVLNVPAVGASLTEVVRRHEVLRCAFVDIEGRPAQMLAPARPVPLPIVDLGLIPRVAGQAIANQVMLRLTRLRFDLSRGAMLRATLLRLAAQRHILFMVLHHIASDAWSSSVLLRELTILYNAFSQNRPSPLADLPLQYADVARWQRRRVSGIRLDQMCQYWKKQLAGIPSSPLRIGRHRRPEVQSFRGGRQGFSVPAGPSESLRDFSRTQGATLYMTLLSAFAVLLCRYTGQDDIVIGSPLSGRGCPETEGLIGSFVNTLPMRCDLSGNPRFNEAVRRVRQAVLAAFAHQELPFERIVAVVSPERKASHTPIYQAVFDFNNTPRATDAASPGLEFHTLGLDTGAAKLDLVVDMWWRGAELAGSVEYNSALLDGDEAVELCQRFEILLSNLAARPGVRLNSISWSDRLDARPATLDPRRVEIETWRRFVAATAKTTPIRMQ
jgi:hypothetical protein